MRTLDTSDEAPFVGGGPTSNLAAKRLVERGFEAWSLSKALGYGHVLGCPPVRPHVTPPLGTSPHLRRTTSLHLPVNHRITNPAGVEPAETGGER